MWPVSPRRTTRSREPSVRTSQRDGFRPPVPPTVRYSFLTSRTEDLDRALPRAIGRLLVDLHVVAALDNRNTVSRLEVQRVPADLVRKVGVLADLDRLERDVSYAGVESGLPVATDLGSAADGGTSRRQELGVRRVHGACLLNVTRSKRVDEGGPKRGDDVCGTQQFRHAADRRELLLQFGCSAAEAAAS